MAAVVSDTSPVRAFVHLDLAHLLHLRFGSIIVPPAVAQELERPVGNYPPVVVTKLPFVKIVSPRDGQHVEILKQELDPGESEAITLALEVRAELFVVDDHKARVLAERLNLSCIGTLGLLLREKRRGEVRELRPLIDRLQNELRFFVSRSLRHQLLQEAGE